jgi:hypothetical protein
MAAAALPPLRRNGEKTEGDTEGTGTAIVVGTGCVRYIGLILGLLLFSVFHLSAGENAYWTVGTYIESETNNEPYSELNLVIVPGLECSVLGNDVPYFFAYGFEHRDFHFNASQGSKYKGNELRNKFLIGYRITSDKLSFKPVYELRVRYFIGYSPSDLAIYENRFHLDLIFYTDSRWIFYLDLMPTLIIDITDSRSDTGESEIYTDYYQEVGAGARILLYDRDILSFGIYNELGINEKVRLADGSLNNGSKINFYEFQIRLSYIHIFLNGIVIAPFARIGLVRNLLYVDAGGVDITKDFRRDRIGVKLNYLADNGIAPNFEAYYQHSNVGDNPHQHRLMWKVGLDYSF